MKTGISLDMDMEAYLEALGRGLRLAPEETRAIVAEVRGNLDDLAAHLRARGRAAEVAEREAVHQYGDADHLARAIRRARRGVPWPLQALAVPLALGALGGAWLGADALATAVVSVSRHTDSLVVDYGLMRRVAGAVFRDPTPAANALGVFVMLTPGVIVLLGAMLVLWLAGAALMGRRMGMRVRRTIISGVALVAAVAGGSAVLAQPTTDAMRVVTTGRGPMILSIDARAGHALVANYNDGSGPGSIDVLDAASGEVRRVIPVGMFPHAMVVDERRGRAFVANEDGILGHMGDSLSVIDTRDGREIRRLLLRAATVTVGIDRVLGRVFIVLQNNRLRMLDAATLRSVGTIGLGFSPGALVADDRHAPRPVRPRGGRGGARDRA